MNAFSKWSLESTNSDRLKSAIELADAGQTWEFAHPSRRLSAVYDHRQLPLF